MRRKAIIGIVAWAAVALVFSVCIILNAQRTAMTMDKLGGKCPACPTCPPEKICPECEVCEACEVCEECPKCEPEKPAAPVNPNTYDLPNENEWIEPVTVTPKIVQYFPIERFPGMECFVIATSVRLLVLTQNCHVAYVNRENITIGQYVIPRQTPNKRCNRCYVSDYINILGFVLFGRPEMGIPPLAPKGFVLMEDDAVVCNAALPILEKCFVGQYNCILGDGAMMNFYAGAFSEQPDGDRYRFNRFTSIDEIYRVGLMNIEHHSDCSSKAIESTWSWSILLIIWLIIVFLTITTISITDAL